MDEMDRSLTFLMHRIVTRVEAAMNKRAHPLGLSVEGVRILIRLAAKDYQTVGDLARQTNIERSTLSRALARMEREGVVRKKRLPADNRAVAISLTPKGRALAKTQLPTFREYERLVLRGITLKKVDAFKAALIAMHRNATTL